MSVRSTPTSAKSSARLVPARTGGTPKTTATAKTLTAFPLPSATKRSASKSPLTKAKSSLSVCPTPPRSSSKLQLTKTSSLRSLNTTSSYSLGATTSTPTARRILKPATAAPSTPECFAKVSLETPLNRRLNQSSLSLLANTSSVSVGRGDNGGGGGDNGEISNLKVAVRIRPMNSKELLSPSVTNVIQLDGSDVIVHAGHTADNSAGIQHRYAMDKVFWSCNSEHKNYCGQEEVYRELARPLLDRAFEGYNTCLFAYGQTSSGKSYSMMGIDAGAGVDAVRPRSIFRGPREILSVVDDQRIVVNDGTKRINIELPARAHVIGFGKGVFGLALELERILGRHLVSGQINVPVNSVNALPLDDRLKTIRVVEASPNNLPDEAAVHATRQIYDWVGTLTQDDVLFVLITGGGSALLPLPCHGVTLNEKLEVIQKLVRKGATIEELNRVRILLSEVKGGKLAEAAKGARQIVSLIISDIVHDPLEFIASGPTVVANRANASHPTAVDILKAYDLWDTLPDNVQRAVITCANTVDKDSATTPTTGDKVANIVIANNNLALETCLTEIARDTSQSVTGVYLSNAVVGNVSRVALGYYQLAKAISDASAGKTQINKCVIRESLRLLSINDDNVVEGLMRAINGALLSAADRDICLVAGGETTVQLKGNGIGGRNQQMVVEFMKLCQDTALEGVYLLSAGTDGIDGPTDAAGAVGGLEILREQFEAEEQAEIAKFIENNDSYNFLKSKPCHLVIGHTGTNVMDVQLLYIQNKGK